MSGLKNSIMALATATTIAVFSAPSANAKSLDGLAIAVSLAGDKLTVGGDTRTLLQLDPGTLQVKARHWIGTAIVNLGYNKDGSILAVQDSQSKLFLYDTSTWKAKYTLSNYEELAVHSASDTMAGIDHNWNGSSVSFNSMKDGANLGKASFEAKERVVGFGFSKDGKKFAVMTTSDEYKGEKKVEYRDIPKDLRGIAREDFQARNDGKMSRVRVIEVPTGKILSDSKSFFTMYEGIAGFAGDKIVWIGRNQSAAVLDAKGEGVIFNTKNGANHGFGFSPDQSIMATGNNGQFSVMSVPAMTTKSHVRLPRLPGATEYVASRVSVSGDNSAIYMTTNAYRVLKIGGDGKLIKAEPLR